MKLTNKGMCRVYKLYTFLVYVIPMIMLFIINYKEFSSDGGLFGFWGIIVLILCVLMFKDFCVGFVKKQPIMSVSVVLIVVGTFAEFLSKYLWIIGVVSLIFGILSGLVLNVAEVYNEHSYTLVDGEKRINPHIALSQKIAWKEAYGYNFVGGDEK